MKKIITILFFLSSVLYGYDTEKKQVKVSYSRLILTSKKNYTYRGEMEIEIKTHEKKEQEISFYLKELKGIEEKFRILDIRVNKEKGSIYKIKTDSNGEAKAKITYKLVLEKDIDRKIESKELDIFKINFLDKYKGEEILSTKVNYLTRATVNISATEIDFGSVEASKALKEGALSKKNSQVKINYNLSKNLENTSIIFIYPKEVYMSHEKNGDTIKVSLNDTNKYFKKDIDGEIIKIELPVEGFQNRVHQFELQGKIEGNEFKNKQLGEYYGTAKLRVYYDFISSGAPEEKNYRPVVRR